MRKNIIRLLSSIYRSIFPLSMMEMYRRMGVEIGEGTKIQFGVIIDYSHYWHVQIGDNVTIAPNVHILAHDASTYKEFGYVKLGKVEINSGAFIGAGSIIMPGVVVGENSIVGAGSVVTRDVPKNTIYVGNPARFVCSTEDYFDRISEELRKYPNFDETYTIRKSVNAIKKNQMNEKMKDRFGFVK